MEMSLCKAGRSVHHALHFGPLRRVLLETMQQKLAGPLIPTHPIKSDKYACGPACVQEASSALV